MLLQEGSIVSALQPLQGKGLRETLIGPQRRTEAAPVFQLGYSLANRFEITV